MILDKHYYPSESTIKNLTYAIPNIDNFKIEIRYIDEFHFTLIIERVDYDGGWGQNLIMNFSVDGDNFDVEIGPSVSKRVVKNITSSKPLQKCDNDKRKIPRKIFQSYATSNVKSNMWRAIQSWQSNNPNYEYHYFDDQDCDEFMRREFDGDTYRAYDSLIPAAFKCDLWRLCVLYKYGGIYADISMECLRSIDDMITDEDLIVIRDSPTNQSYIYQAFIASEPKNPSIWRIIKHTVEIVLSQRLEYGRKGINCLMITGPGVFGRALNMSLNKERDRRYILGKFDYDDVIFKVLDFRNSRIIDGDIEYINAKYQNWHKDRDNEHYSVLVRRGRIFKISMMPN